MTTTRDDEYPAGGQPDDGPRLPTTPAEAVPPDPPVGRGVPTRVDTDVPEEETPRSGGPVDTYDDPVQHDPHNRDDPRLI
ncbi:hypothetical protein [Geodermatophilus sp. CPCC 205761]|uniref:hypothetical protein n=1 Tax=Geodermatophilus sp. CPCC 205761 TaxID=2936597 RepID=UPI003EF0724C